MPTSSTKNYTTQDLLNSVVGEHNAVADGNGNALVGGGVYVGTPTAVANGDLVRRWLNAYGYPNPERQTILLGSLNGAVATTTATLGTATGLGVFKDMDILINVTATGGSTATLTVYIDSRLDGTTWSNLAAGAIMTTADTQVVHLTKRNPATAINVNAVAGAGTVRAIGWADDLRVRYTLTGATSTADFRVWANGVG